MPRPKKGQDVPAVDRMRDAFWTLLAEKPYAALSVADVLRSTGLNKNAFYYHYGNLGELAKDAVEQMLPTDLMVAVLREIIDPKSKLDALLRDPKYHVHLDRLSLIAGKHGSPQLQGTLKRAMKQAWIGMLGIDEANLGFNSSLAIEFALGGVFSLLAYRAEHLPDMTTEQLFGSRFGQRMRRTVPPMLLETFLDEGVISESALLATRFAPTSS